MSLLSVHSIAVNKGPLVSQESDAQDFSNPDGTMKEPETYDEYYALYDAFISGGKLWTFLPNVQDCSYYSHIFLNEANLTWEVVGNFTSASGDDTAADSDDTEEDSISNTESASYNTIRNVSQLISNQYAESYLYCHLTVVDGYIFYISENEKYESWLDYF